MHVAMPNSVENDLNEFILAFMPIVQISDFTRNVLNQIKAIPQGKVATYKQIAELAGKPQGSRGVAWILKSCSTKYKLPWHRVLSSQGKISFERNTHNFRDQKRKLEKEGVVIQPDGRLDLKKYKMNKKARKTTKDTNTKNRPKMFG